MSSQSGADQPGRDPGRTELAVTVGVVAGVAVLAAVTHPEPAGTAAVDAFWSAGVAALVSMAGARARHGQLLWLGAVAALCCVGGGVPVAVVGVLALLGAIALIVSGQQSRIAGALVAGVAVLALLNGPSFGFTGLPSLVTAVAVVPVLWGGWRSLRARGRRRTLVAVAGVAAVMIVATAMAGIAAFRVRSELYDSASAARDGLALVRTGSVTAASPVLEQSAQGFSSASSILDGPLGLAGRLVPIVGNQVAATARVAAAGEEVASSAAKAAGVADYHSLRADGGRIDLTQLAAMREPVTASLAAAQHARTVSAEVRSPWLLPALDSKLDEFDDQLAEAETSGELAARALDVAPGLLGADQPRRYLLQFASPGESRAAGGYVGTYGVLTATDGELDLQFTASTDDLKVPDDQPPLTFVPPEGWERLYSGFHVDRYPGNVTADPDWPTDSSVARQLYAQVPDVGTVDGVMYADPEALAAFLKVTGPIEVAGVPQPLDADNVEQYLLIDQYAIFDSDTDAGNLARRQALEDLISAVFDSLSTRELPDVRDLLDSLGPAVSGGHLKLAVFDQAGEELMDSVGLSGAWDPTPGADYLSLRSTDLFSNKIDTFIERTVSVEVDHDQATGAVQSTVTITLTNTAPSSGPLPWYIVGNYSGYPSGTARDRIDLYSPMGLQSATLDGEGATMQRNTYATGNVYALPVTLAAGETRRLTVTLEGTVPAGFPYLLDLLPQPRANPDRFSVTLSEGGAMATLFDGSLESQQLVGVAAVG